MYEKTTKILMESKKRLDLTLAVGIFPFKCPSLTLDVCGKKCSAF